MMSRGKPIPGVASGFHCMRLPSVGEGIPSVTRDPFIALHAEGDELPPRCRRCCSARGDRGCGPRRKEESNCAGEAPLCRCSEASHGLLKRFRTSTEGVREAPV